MLETIILIILFTCIIIYKYKYKSNAIAVEAFNKQPYLVNDLNDSQDAANMLARIMLVLEKLVNNICSDYDKNVNSRTNDDNIYIENVRTIKKKLPSVRISENPIDSQFTSYSINKGEELVFCIRDKKKYKIHDINELLYVAIHEIAHIGCPEVGHTQLFQDINAYLLKKAICYNFYTYIDYSIENKNYCGMILTNNLINSSDINCT